GLSVVWRYRLGNAPCTRRRRSGTRIRCSRNVLVRLGSYRRTQCARSRTCRRSDARTMGAADLAGMAVGGSDFSDAWMCLPHAALVSPEHLARPDMPQTGATDIKLGKALVPRTIEQRDELAPPHSITSSVGARSF